MFSQANIFNECDGTSRSIYAAIEAALAPNRGKPFSMPSRSTTHLAFSGSVVDRCRAVVHADGEEGRMSLREVQAGHATVRADRTLRVFGVSDLTQPDKHTF